MSGNLKIVDCENDSLGNSIVGYDNAEVFTLNLPIVSSDSDAEVLLEDFTINAPEGWFLFGFPFDLSTVTKIEYIDSSGIVQGTNNNPTLTDVYIYTKPGEHIDIGSTQKLNLISEGYEEEINQSLRVIDIFGMPGSDGVLDIVKNYEGSAYLPEYYFDGIGVISNYESLQVKSNTSFSLRFKAKRNYKQEGENITYGSYVNLWPGWILFNWPLKKEMDVVLALAGVVENIQTVKDYNGSGYLPEYNFNGIGNFIPGHGYQIKVNDGYSSKFFIAENE
tara:strand:- start:657 stop:1490 length:834 start_codon:yes stop_codon:yes gene_type:complete